MSILINENTKVICQGFTGKAGTFHSNSMIEYGTKLVAGISPQKGGSYHLGIPVYDSIAEAKKEHEIDASIIFVPKDKCISSILEAIDSEIPLVVCITENIPILDMLKIKQLLKKSKTKLIGPNCPGIIVPGKCKIGIMPSSIHKKGDIAIISRSGTLTYEAVHQVTNLGLGQSLCIGIGGDPIKGIDFVDCIKMIKSDESTKGVIVIGEIGGSSEEELSEFLKDNDIGKPIVGFIAGLNAPKGKRMGHAGAIISNGLGAAEGKIKALEEAGVIITKNPEDIGLSIKREMDRFYRKN